MKTKTELDQDILNITLKINQEFPELAKYLQEMPVTVPDNDNSKVNLNSLNEYYDSLVVMMKNYSKTHSAASKGAVDKAISGSSKNANQISSEDIYDHEKEEEDIDPENISKNKSPNAAVDSPNEKDFQDDMSGSDLDIPGSELDDQQESIGSEDEENNYYSIGRDNHNDLEEDKG